MSLLPNTIIPRFSYVKYDAEHQQTQARFRQKFEELEKLGAELLIGGRAQSLFMTALEEAYMWTGKAIRDAQIIKNNLVDELPARSEE
jgi:hypothetical protein